MERRCVVAVVPRAVQSFVAAIPALIRVAADDAAESWTMMCTLLRAGMIRSCCVRHCTDASIAWSFGDDAAASPTMALSWPTRDEDVAASRTMLRVCTCTSTAAVIAV